ncbi:MAG: hypothetical protein AAGG68_14300 [Bacteroidota bacterium]
MNLVYLSCQLITILLVIGLAGAIIFAARRTFQKIKLYQSQNYIQYLQLAIFFWLFLLAILAMGDIFMLFSQSLYLLIFAFCLPLLLIIILAFNRTFGRLLRLVPATWLIRIQAFRILLELMFWLGYKGNFIPIQMTFEFLNQDIIVGVTALFAASLFFGKGRFRKLEAIIWNFFGILLLLNLLIVAFYSFPSGFQVFDYQPNSTFLVDIPFVWIIGFLIPFGLAMHLFSLRQVFLMNPQKRNRIIGIRR